jgi:hypothetical protein
VRYKYVVSSIQEDVRKRSEYVQNIISRVKVGDSSSNYSISSDDVEKIGYSINLIKDYVGFFVDE